MAPAGHNLISVELRVFLVRRPVFRGRAADLCQAPLPHLDNLLYHPHACGPRSAYPSLRVGVWEQPGGARVIDRRGDTTIPGENFVRNGSTVYHGSGIRLDPWSHYSTFCAAYSRFSTDQVPSACTSPGARALGKTCDHRAAGCANRVFHELVAARGQQLHNEVPLSIMVSPPPARGRARAAPNRSLTWSPHPAECRPLRVIAPERLSLPPSRRRRP